MPHAEATAAIRNRVHRTFAELAIDAGEQVRETILIRGGMYCGRRFEGEGGHAVWFVEEDQLKFFSADGSVIRVLERASMHEDEVRAAA